ncbi:MAG: RNA polymerase sigma factor [Gemmatimonadaceae bacterium]
MTFPACDAPAAASAVSGVVAIDAAVRRAQRGDVAAFEHVYKAHAPAIHQLCRRMCGDDRLARELVQDVFVRAWERMPSFRGESGFGTWLHRLAVNVVLGQLRSRARHTDRFVTISEVSSATRSPEYRAGARIDLEAALARLPERTRTVFLLHDVYGYSHDEIAASMGMAAATSRVQLWRAHRALIRLLDR